MAARPDTDDMEAGAAAGAAAAASSTSNFFKVLGGHMSSTATANHIAKIEVIRHPETFSDVVRGLHVFGRKVLRSDALQCRHLLID